MREISRQDVVDAIARLSWESNLSIDEKIVQKIREQRDSECGLAKEVLTQIVDNNDVAKKSQLPLCQDTGITVVFAEVGRDLHLTFDLQTAINEGIKIGYEHLRKSVVGHPLKRENTKDNTPAIVHVELVEGDKLHLQLAPKGAGSENMSQMRMLTPAEGLQGVKDFVLETIFSAKGKPCPPIIVGVGIGGNFEYAPYLAKKALMRPIDDIASNAEDKALEDELLDEINELGIGPMGIGGTQTALAVKVNSAPCHIASLPVAVNIQCHVARMKEVTL